MALARLPEGGRAEGLVCIYCNFRVREICVCLCVSFLVFLLLEFASWGCVVLFPRRLGVVE